MKEKSYKIMEKLSPIYFSKLKEAIKLIEQYELHLMRDLMMNLKGYEFKGMEVKKKVPRQTREICS